MSNYYKYVIKSPRSSIKEENHQKPAKKRQSSKTAHYEDDIYEEETNSKRTGEVSFLETIINLIKKANPLGGGLSGLIKELLSSTNNQGSSNSSDIMSMLSSLFNSSQNKADSKDPLASLSMLRSLFNNSGLASNLFSELNKSAAKGQGSNSNVNESINSDSLQDALNGFKDILSSLSSNQG